MIDCWTETVWPVHTSFQLKYRNTVSNILHKFHIGSFRSIVVVEVVVVV